jgi:chromosome segregation ATPase
MDDCKTPGMCSPFGGCQDPAQSELAALRKELAEIKESMAYRGSLLGRTEQRLKAAEQWSAEQYKQNETLRGLIAKGLGDLDASQGREAELREELAKVIEDRARFPDRPDFIGNMISAHIGNLKAKAESAEKYSRSYWMKLTVAEQQNADAVRLLTALYYATPIVWPDVADFLALAKPTESGASE